MQLTKARTAPGQLTESRGISAESRGISAVPSEAQCLAVVARLRSSELFSHWQPANVHRLVCGGVMQWRELGRYSVVHREGQPSHSFFIVVSGAVALSSSRQAEEQLLEPGDTFGHGALVLNPREQPMPHLHTAVTRQRTWLLALSQAALRAMDSHDALRLQLEAHTPARLATSALAECACLANRLSLFALFEKVGRMRLLQLARSVSYVEVPAGFALIREGQKATRFCLLLHGSVVVSRRAPSSAAEAGREISISRADRAEIGARSARDRDRAEITLALISAEDEAPYFGENCILSTVSTQMPVAASATVATRERSHLLVVYPHAAADFLRALPEFGTILLERKAMLRKANDVVTNHLARW